MVEVNWTDQAIKDVNNIAEFIGKDSIKYANIQVNIFFERVKLLNHQPYSGKIAPELNKEKIRELNSGNYRIIYLVVSKNRIDILTVYNGYKLLRKNQAKH